MDRGARSGAQTGLAEAVHRLAEADALRAKQRRGQLALRLEIARARERLEKAERELGVAFSTLRSDLDAVLAKRLARLGEARRGVEDTAEAMTAAPQRASADALAAQRESAELLADLARRFAETRARAEASRRRSMV